MRQEVLWTAALLLCFGLLGFLPRGQEPEELTLLTELAVDRREGAIGVTALVGVRATEDEEPELLTGEGPALTVAVAALEDSPLRRPYLGQVETLLVGKSLEGELEEVLHFVLEHRELKTDSTLYIVEGDAGALLEAWAGETAGKTRPKDPSAVTVGEALARLSQGRPVRVPVLALDEEGKVVGEEALHGEKSE